MKKNSVEYEAIKQIIYPKEKLCLLCKHLALMLILINQLLLSIIMQFQQRKYFKWFSPFSATHRKD